MKPTARILLMLLLGTAVAGIGWQLYTRIDSATSPAPARDKQNRPAPVVTAPIATAAIARELTFSGTLESSAGFVAAPKVSGIVERLFVNLGDPVERGQVVAELDNAEYVQAVAQAEAELEVARANLAEAGKLLTIADRELRRIDQLSERGVTSASQRDAAQAEQLARQAHEQVTRAQMAHAQAQLETARIRLSYTQVTADWHGEDSHRVVAERYVDEGETVSANTPLLKIVRLDPITAVIFVTERDYAGLHPGQEVSLETDAHPDLTFTGIIERIAPVFRQQTRQARVEIAVNNPREQLKPGMFVRARVVLDRVEQASVIPLQGLARRDGQDGVFVVAQDGQSVAWRTVATGIQQGERLQISGAGLQGDVVILGQQLLTDGSSVIVTESRKQP